MRRKNFYREKELKPIKKQKYFEKKKFLNSKKYALFNILNVLENIGFGLKWSNQ